LDAAEKQKALSARDGNACCGPDARPIHPYAHEKGEGTFKSSYLNSCQFGSIGKSPFKDDAMRPSPPKALSRPSSWYASPSSRRSRCLTGSGATKREWQTDKQEGHPLFSILVTYKADTKN